MEPTLLFQDKTGGLVGVFDKEDHMDAAMRELGGSFSKIPISRVSNWDELKDNEFVRYTQIRFSQVQGQPK
jgi:hypothetical protein